MNTGGRTLLSITDVTITEFFSSTSGVIVDLGTDLSDGSWHRVIVVYDANDNVVRLTIDNVELVDMGVPDGITIPE